MLHNGNLCVFYTTFITTCCTKHELTKVDDQINSKINNPCLFNVHVTQDDDTIAKEVEIYQNLHCKISQNFVHLFLYCSS